jgi:2'-5' RNA ligase
VRAFIAIDLPLYVVETLGSALRSLNSGDVPGLRPVGADSMHVTLRFLGDVPSDQLEPIAEAMSRAASFVPPFHLKLGRYGAFPPKGSPRVLWVGLNGDVAAARQLHALLQEALTELGHLPETRPFTPHITLARLVRNAGDLDRRRSLQALKTSSPVHADFEVGSISLMASHLSPYKDGDGPRYEKLAVATLGSRPGDA